MTPPATVAILTVSDRCARGTAEDTSGPALAELAATQLGARIVAATCVPDDLELIAAQLDRWARDTPRPDLILTTGGTGLSPRDVTPEATLRVLERRHSALLQLARLRCYERAPQACLSRGESGTIGQSLVVNLPGSRRGATETLQALIDVLPHAIEALQDRQRHGKM